jgi:cytochrome c oxidase subunit 2
MKAIDDFNLGDFRILDVDNRVILPTFINVRLCFRGADVIHSWTLPTAGVKVDCSPGLLNCVSVNFPLVGLYFGQCREICGSNHSFIPIAVEIVP